MKTLFTSLLFLIGSAGIAQAPTKSAPAKTAAKPAEQAPTQNSSATVLTEKQKELCKEWTLSKTENFGDQHDPTEKQKNDRLLLLADGHYRLILNGVVEGGTWTLDKSNVWLTLTNGIGEVKKFKILESTPTSLKVDYRDEIDIHNILYYTSGPAPSKGK
ncbi:MAG TPA: hypothetical protein VI731_12150 [Bacteroidia bacterium]|nr:hypothetical protein [Bacteroidia bacterium]